MILNFTLHALSRLIGAFEISLSGLEIAGRERSESAILVLYKLARAIPIPPL